jgi:hypothetical protein
MATANEVPLLDGRLRPFNARRRCVMLSRREKVEKKSLFRPFLNSVDSDYDYARTVRGGLALDPAHHDQIQRAAATAGRKDGEA